MQLEKECQVYGRGGWGPCLFLLPGMCVLQLLAFVQDMIMKGTETAEAKASAHEMGKFGEGC